MSQKAIQEHYSDEVSHCYGCGRLNSQGLQIKSYWDDEKNICICRHTPNPVYLSMPGYVYGGLIASLIDCHAMATAAAFAHREAQKNGSMTSDIRFVTRALKVEYLKPTPMGVTLLMMGRVEQATSRKAIVQVELTASDILCAKGEVVAVKAPKDMLETSS